jgi:hypothetical protein
LGLNGIPYAYAAQTSTSYHIENDCNVNPGGDFCFAACNPGDYATGGGFHLIPDAVGAGATIVGSGYHAGTNPPTSWSVNGHNPSASTFANGMQAQVICQTPITVAGIGVPKFGSLYVAIALGAVAYFLLSRRFMARPTPPAQAWPEPSEPDGGFETGTVVRREGSRLERVSSPWEGVVFGGKS